MVDDPRSPVPDKKGLTRMPRQAFSFSGFCLSSALRYFLPPLFGISIFETVIESPLTSPVSATL
jgi:hypothetical protein